MPRFTRRMIGGRRRRRGGRRKTMRGGAPEGSLADIWGGLIAADTSFDGGLNLADGALTHVSQLAIPIKAMKRDQQIKQKDWRMEMQHAGGGKRRRRRRRTHRKKHRKSKRRTHRRRRH